MDDLHIGNSFTLQDIRKIRDYNYEMTKGMTWDERIAYYNTYSDEAKAIIEEMRAKRSATKTAGKPELHFDAMRVNTAGFVFDREEAHRRKDVE